MKFNPLLLISFLMATTTSSTYAASLSCKDIKTLPDFKHYCAGKIEQGDRLRCVVEDVYSSLSIRVDAYDMIIDCKESRKASSLTIPESEVSSSISRRSFRAGLYYYDALAAKNSIDIAIAAPHTYHLKFELDSPLYKTNSKNTPVFVNTGIFIDYKLSTFITQVGTSYSKEFMGPTWLEFSALYASYKVSYAYKMLELANAFYLPVSTDFALSHIKTETTARMKVFEARDFSIVLGVSYSRFSDSSSSAVLRGNGLNYQSKDFHIGVRF